MVKNPPARASLVAQWLGVCLLVRGMRVPALVWEDPACRGASWPVGRSCWACGSGACAPRRGGRGGEGPACRGGGWPLLAVAGEGPRAESEDPTQPKINR